MELLIVSSVAYLALTLLFYPDGFIRNAAIWIEFCAFYAMSLISQNDYLLFIFTAVAFVFLSLYVDISIGDLIEIIPISITAAFWLNISEFVDGFAFSYLAVSLGIVAISIILFRPVKRLYLSITSILFSYGILFLLAGNIDVNAFAISICVAWILCPLPIKSKSFSLFDKNATKLYLH